jgi:ATP/ADP translocase
VLSLPLPAELRTRLKAFIDVVGQRGGQAVASLAFLALAELGMVGAMGRADLALGGVLIVLCVTWIVLAAGIKRHYFGQRSRHGARAWRSLPDRQPRAIRRPPRP